MTVIYICLLIVAGIGFYLWLKDQEQQELRFIMEMDEEMRRRCVTCEQLKAKAEATYRGYRDEHEQQFKDEATKGLDELIDWVHRQEEVR